MSDREKLEAMLREWHVPFRKMPSQDGGMSVLTGGFNGSWPAWDAAEVVDGDEQKVDGYSGFYTMFEFAPDGSFEHMGSWE